jgi:CHAT domain-containing protein
MNANAARFSALSHSLYTKLFQPLKMPAGRIVICPDNFILPFEAFCSDEAGKHFLAYDYVFSYVYSAGYLLKKFNPFPSKGNFIGFAPVSFRSYLQVPDLKQSVVSLEDAAEQYGRTVLFTNSRATKRNFIQRIPEYDIVSVFSHAYADTSGNEPVLYMQDSMIHLSELQLLDHSAIRLIVLSACETNVGKNATGEGIYSLARGFAAAGIPSVAATMWKADEEAMYAISQNFHKYLSMGMRKDDALQKAKLDFIKGGKKNAMPYFWANMIVIGNTDAIEVNSYWNNYLWIVIPAAVICLILIVVWGRKIPSRLKTTLRSA